MQQRIRCHTNGFPISNIWVNLISGVARICCEEGQS